ncbi:sulfite reductase, assimilatory-type [Clostridium pasteurianum DSM 525 = ATCC 6013]|uniref:Nitrite reductase (NAD(P)H) n=1 Tax=Clostridium pasteurianum DSM 525 = ATCC 6013 TaxID=1262449 RepID=A0A0H3J8N7_CLOPA|nr:NAD(P)/FAD-dependent oxidoreductase [Clostridium pasteurianum]AJA48318.1 sulfite reductase, assimilatory-type [Clostridium pasteurianum DSM 525 = ATCC 6013]AJA52306.1 sulfite reductase, assimilatory-type [Clostridium pasteurianum DSM 525 = ATCC 6013]AOZ75569.1 sulfite reductase [Clostridium pasteurianum DSM 525 = ATCC 6013]AOZ79364.1 sulfite reductase [Clostridium pasteurianum]ELP60533.1 nitrite and sulfite reductase 4Fe-4S subunit [Clostridium pasteurianum DSM 525 = ATCC 6013]
MKTDLLEKGAIVQRDKETYAVAPHLTAGIVTPDNLRTIADIAEKYNAAAIKVTGAQRIAIVGLKEEDLDNVWKDLDMNPGAAIGLCVRSVKVCPGTTFCKRGLQDSVAVGSKLDSLYHGKKLPNKFKMGVSGCPNSCADSAFKDIGLIGSGKGWMFYVGGKGGARPRIADKIAACISEEKIYDLVEKVIQVYEENATVRERLGSYIDRVGLDEFKKQIDLDSYL